MQAVQPAARAGLLVCGVSAAYRRPCPACSGQHCLPRRGPSLPVRRVVGPGGSRGSGWSAGSVCPLGGGLFVRARGRGHTGAVRGLTGTSRTALGFPRPGWASAQTSAAQGSPRVQHHCELTGAAACGRVSSVRQGSVCCLPGALLPCRGSCASGAGLPLLPLSSPGSSKATGQARTLGSQVGGGSVKWALLSVWLDPSGAEPGPSSRLSLSGLFLLMELGGVGGGSPARALCTAAPPGGRQGL